jgi:hypothetical protein
MDQIQEWTKYMNEPNTGIDIVTLKVTNLMP